MSAPSINSSPLATVFISYSTEDSAMAELMRSRIERSGIRCFFAPRDIPAQHYWKAGLEDAIRQANLLVLLYTDSAAKSEYVRLEVQEALRVNTEIWVVLDPKAEVPSFFEDLECFRRQSFLLREGKEVGCFDQVRTEIDRLYSVNGSRFQGQITANNCPYPGPKPFSVAYKDVFFGRHDTTVQLMTAINDTREVVLVYGPSGAGKTSLLTVGLPDEVGSGWFYPPPMRANTAFGLLRKMLSALAGSHMSVPSISDKELIPAILAMMKAEKPNRYLFCFDQMEEFFTENPNPTDITLFLDSIREILEKRTKLVKILISFRKEFLADVRRRIDDYDYFGDKLLERAIWKLSTLDAMPCITDPAKRRDVTFDNELAEAMMAALIKGQVGEPIVNPMDIQKVCKALWEEIATLNGAPHSQIDGVKLARVLRRWHKPTSDIQSDASAFVDKVLADFLRTTIKDVAGKLGAYVQAPDPAEYVTLSLMDFVGSGNVRQRVSEIELEGQRWVAQLPLEIVRGLVNAGLVQSSGDHAYELAHDALAKEIAEYGETSDAVFARKSLDAVLKREGREKHVFNQHADLLVKLEAVRNNRRPFAEVEADFLLRCALGDQRRTIKGSPVSLEAWTEMLGQKSTARLVNVLKDGLSDDAEESVQLDVMDLLTTPYVRDMVGSHLDELGAQLQKLALTGSDQIRAGACSALVALRYRDGIRHLFEGYRQGRQRTDTRTALALVRDAVDTMKGPADTFREFWKDLGLWSRLSILARLLRWRCGQSYGRILFMIAVTAPITAIGAILPFVIMGPLGASLTLEAKGLGLADGIFHGATGGLVWGAGATTGVLAYSVLWRGGRIRRIPRENIAMSIFGMLGAGLGGFVNAAVISFVFATEGLINGGWLEPGSTEKRLYQVAVLTRHGWIMPIFGAALGLGIGWSLARILADPDERWRGSPYAGPNKAVKAVGNSDAPARNSVMKRLGRICTRVGQECWCNVFWLVVGSLAIYFLIRPGHGVCDPSVHILPKACYSNELAPKWARTAGLAVIILGGSLFLEVGFLASLLSVQLGVNLRKQRSFLMSAQAKAQD